MVYTEELRIKDEKIDNAIKVLKNEFVGIDEQIESILNNMRTWYLYPNLQDRPLVISLWGLTGVGKTCVIKRIAELLDIEKDMVYFNFAEIGECTSWEVENKLEEELSNDKSNRMFIYDEFQYAATLDAMGNEKDKKSGLKPFWELLDNGKIHKRDNFWVARQMYQLLRYFIRINDFEPMKIVNGEWVNAEECLSGFNHYERSKFKNYFQWEEKDKIGGNEEDAIEEFDGPMSNERYETLVDENSHNTFFIRQSYIERLMNLLDQNENTSSDILDFHHRITKMNIDEIIELIDSACNNAMKGYDLDFKNSIIFVIGNLDEAYEMALDVDPDMSPDQFHKATKNITIVDIKKALQQRFRNEQIARLGNIHVIYPSFTSDTFRKIIKLTLDNYAKDVFKLTGFKLTYDKSLIDIIYKDAVFPTHGTRPIFSSVHEFVKSKFPIIVHDIAVIDNNTDNIEINYSFKRKNTIVKAYNGSDLIYERKFKEKLRLEELRKSTKDEEQALVAVHESGHFVMYAKLHNKLPEKVCSRTTDKSTGGFLLKDVDDYNGIETKEELMNDIKIALGGYVAETVVFGYRNISNGAQSDLRTATKIASRIVRDYGMDNFDCAVTTYLMNAIEMNDNGGILFDSNISDTNSKIKRIIGICRDEVQATFQDLVWKNMLKKSAEYLAVHSSMPKNKMNEIYDEIPDKYKKTDNTDTFYRDKLKNF